MEVYRCSIWHIQSTALQMGLDKRLWTFRMWRVTVYLKWHWRGGWDRWRLSVLKLLTLSRTVFVWISCNSNMGSVHNLEQSRSRTEVGTQTLSLVPGLGLGCWCTDFSAHWQERKQVLQNFENMPFSYLGIPGRCQNEREWNRGSGTACKKNQVIKHWDWMGVQLILGDILRQVTSNCKWNLLMYVRNKIFSPNLVYRTRKKAREV